MATCATEFDFCCRTALRMSSSVPVGVEMKGVATA